jgi:hypothetical protein
MRRKIGSFSVGWMVVYAVGVAISMASIFLGHSLWGALAIWLGIIIMAGGLIMLWNEYMEAWVHHDND